MKCPLILAVLLLSAAPAAAETTVTVGNTIISSSNKGPTTTTTSGGAAIDSKKTIDCISSKGCVLLLQAMVEVANKGTPSAWAICVLVDKSVLGANPNCPVQGTLPPSGTSPADTETGNVQQSAIVKKGKHTVQTGIFVNVKVKVGSWQTTYTLLKE
jgi:hypothetical protein